MAARVLAPEAGDAGQIIILPADESSHVARVLRLGIGDRLRVFDGRGREWDAEVVAARDRVSVRLGAAVMPAAETRVRYTLAPAVLKGDATDELIRDAVMLGAATLRPFVATRSETRLATLVRGHRHERWQRVAIASAKQCGRAVVPPVDAPATFAEMLAGSADPLRVLLVEPATSRPAVMVSTLARPSAVTLAFGPEGGWTPEEIDAATAAGWTLVRLGARTLRATTMAVAALAAFQAVWDEP